MNEELEQLKSKVTKLDKKIDNQWKRFIVVIDSVIAYFFFVFFLLEPLTNGWINFAKKIWDITPYEVKLATYSNLLLPLLVGLIMFFIGRYSIRKK